MSIRKEERQKEEKRLRHVLMEMNKTMAGLERDLSVQGEELRTWRGEFWEDVTVNLSDDKEALETVASITQQARVMSELERRQERDRRRYQTLARMIKSPYFGRVDFMEEGETEEEQIYIGIASFVEETSQTHLVYDWRAPISSMFYDGMPGEVEYETPMGTVKGHMGLKRQYLIKNGKLVSVFDTGTVIGDDILKEVLGHRSDTQMKNIVATIQKEQNRIIRDDRTKVVLVQGAAGSGKTSVALQRIAYLLYKHRSWLSHSQVLLFSPNPIFMSYVSNVLPELGEENIKQTTFQEYVEHRLGKAVHIEDAFDQLEYVLTRESGSSLSARLHGIGFKSSADFFRLMQDYKHWLEQEGMIFRDLRLNDQVMIASEQIKERFYAYEPNVKLANRIQMVRKWLLDELDQLAEQHIWEDWVGEEVEFLEKEDYYQAYKPSLRGKPDVDEHAKAELVLRKKVVRRKFQPVINQVKQLKFVDVNGIYQQLFDEPLVTRLSTKVNIPDAWGEICAYTRQFLQKRIVPYEDVTPLLYLQEMIQGVRRYMDIRYVLIDEAQDYSPFQLKVMQAMFPMAKMTILGDWNQAIMPHQTRQAELEQITSLFQEGEIQQYEMTRSYRSTSQIVEFTRELLTDAKPITPFHREGPLPVVRKLATQAELVQRLQEDLATIQAEGYESLAVIGKSQQECQMVYEQLKDHVPVTLLTKNDRNLASGVVILPVYLAKGIEFDAVVIYNFSRENYGDDTERKRLYTACTRAMHRLFLYALGEPSPLLSQVDQRKYVWM
ncbi:RNA polymerase recycling motor HelD [Laceyella putida]|uniref:RNA polymerase recycling motor HelD n=1 Tax=Laceyella putida TaxID=110101 RepID=A0ABW2RNI9_9BACL